MRHNVVSLNFSLLIIDMGYITVTSSSVVIRCPLGIIRLFRQDSVLFTLAASTEFAIETVSIILRRILNLWIQAFAHFVEFTQRFEEFFVMSLDVSFVNLYGITNLKATFLLFI